MQKDILKIIYNRRLLFILITTSIMVAARISIAAETYNDLESTVTIEFEEGDAQVGPVNPENPEEPGNGTGEGSGSLALNYVSHLFFEDQVISASREEYPSITPQPYIQVTDLRGSGEGWEVTARASKFNNDDSGAASLLGSSIVFKDASTATSTEMIEPPVPKDPLILPADGKTTKEVVTAERLTGMGTWLTKWYTDPEAELNYSVKLEVPGGSAMKGKNIAKITWYLRDVPTEE